MCVCVLAGTHFLKGNIFLRREVTVRAGGKVSQTSNSGLEPRGWQRLLQRHR